MHTPGAGLRWARCAARSGLPANRARGSSARSSTSYKLRDSTAVSIDVTIQLRKIGNLRRNGVAQPRRRQCFGVGAKPQHDKLRVAAAFEFDLVRRPFPAVLSLSGMRSDFVNNGSVTQSSMLPLGKLKCRDESLAAFEEIGCRALPVRGKIETRGPVEVERQHDHFAHARNAEGAHAFCRARDEVPR